MDVSPHSYDSGKGSSIRLSSNGNSQVSGWQTTSSLNSTPHSFNETQLNLPGFHMYRIDEYLKAANEFVQFLPETLQLHNRILSQIGLEPNANCSDNMMRFINYAEVCQQICKQDAMSECLQRLLSRAVRLWLWIVTIIIISIITIIWWWWSRGARVRGEKGEQWGRLEEVWIWVAEREDGERDRRTQRCLINKIV